jgi:RNA polymerase sigma-70 factor (ECF subfamily)
MRRGDAGALETWYHRHVDGVYGFVFYRVGRNRDLAAEVTQETFTRALARLGEFDAGRGPMIAWLCTLSRNCVREALRGRGHEPLASLWESVDASLQRVYEDLDREPIAAALVEARETRELVGMALASLPDKYSTVLRQRYVENMPVERIAAEARSTTDAVKGVLKRARAAFRQTFAALAGARPYIEELGGL